MFRYAFDNRTSKWVVLIDDIVMYVFNTESECIKKYNELIKKYAKNY